MAQALAGSARLEVREGTGPLSNPQLQRVRCDAMATGAEPHSSLAPKPTATTGLALREAVSPTAGKIEAPHSTCQSILAEPRDDRHADATFAKVVATLVEPERICRVSPRNRNHGMLALRRLGRRASTRARRSGFHRTESPSASGIGAHPRDAIGRIGTPRDPPIR